MILSLTSIFNRCLAWSIFVIFYAINWILLHLLLLSTLVDHGILRLHYCSREKNTREMKMWNGIQILLLKTLFLNGLLFKLLCG